MALFLVRHDEGSAVAPEAGLALDRFELRPGMSLVDSDLSPLLFTSINNLDQRDFAERVKPLDRFAARTKQHDISG